MTQEKPQAAKAFEQLPPIKWFYATEYRQQEDGTLPVVAIASVRRFDQTDALFLI
jgi:hypothetical protein